MSNVDRIHRTKQGRRPHYLREWMERRHLMQKDLVTLIGADKSLVSRWLAEEKWSTPGPEYQDKLREVLQIEDEEGIFRHPDDDWMSRFLRGRDPQEIERIKATLEAAFPKRATG